MNRNFIILLFNMRIKNLKKPKNIKVIQIINGNYQINSCDLKNEKKFKLQFKKNFKKINKQEIQKDFLNKRNRINNKRI